MSTVYINDDPELTLTYFKARSSLAKFAYFALTMSLCQISGYRTISFLVFAMLPASAKIQWKRNSNCSEVKLGSDTDIINH